MKQLRLFGAVLSALLCQTALADCDERTGKNCLYIAAPTPLTPEQIKKREQEEQARREEARREQQQVDDELARRGWPKTREQEVRRFFEMKKTAAAAAPKVGAGSALQDDAAPLDDAQARWLKKQLDEQQRAAVAPEPLKSLAPDKKEESKRQAFPETIMVCTKPIGTKGRFECRSPVTVQHGHIEDISGHRTPEQMVASSSAGCPAPRRLPSATHLVWGCGFGATNNSNSLDRSAGVDVQGRNTYYCTPKETSCRRTSP